MKAHIELYVNDFSVDLGSEGKSAIINLYEKATKNGVISSVPKDIFVY